jgi:hypothetical protein
MHRKGLPNLVFGKITNIRSIESLASNVEIDRIQEWQINYLSHILKSTDVYQLARRLLSRIFLVREFEKQPIDDRCWIIRGDWSKYTTFEGELAHRLSYRLFVGALIAGRCICHKCDRPGCINHRHLFQGTNKDNLDDHNKKYIDYRNGRLINGKLKEVVKWMSIKPTIELVGADLAVRLMLSKSSGISLRERLDRASRSKV